MFHSVGIFRTSSPEDSISSNPERTAPGRWGKESSYIEVCNKGQVGLPRWHSGKEPTCWCTRHRKTRFCPWIRKIHWRRKWQLAPVFLPGKSHGQRSLAGYSPWGRRVRCNWAHTHAQSEHQKYFCELKKTRYPKLSNVALFFVWEDARVWAHWNHSFHMHLSYLGPVSCIFHILSTSRCREWLQPNAADPRSSSLSWLPWRAGIRWWCWHPCLLIWQEIFQFSPFREESVLPPGFWMASCSSLPFRPPWVRGTGWSKSTVHAREEILELGRGWGLSHCPSVFCDSEHQSWALGTDTRLLKRQKPFRRILRPWLSWD